MEGGWVVTTDAQVRKLMEEIGKHGRLEVAAARSGMHRNTASKYRRLGKLPSEMKEPRGWRTRADPFVEDWADMEAWLEQAPEIEAKALFEHLRGQQPERYHEGQLRTFQRRVRQWRAENGPGKEVMFEQRHRPGEAMQTDFTWATCLGITIAGEAFAHMLCHVVLPYSNWGWATVCRSESMAALRHGVQEAVFYLGKVPEYNQTDNSTAATHDLRTGKRGFNDEYLALMRHLGMKPRTIEVGEKHQNGDVEALNGALKRRLEQHLLLRGSRDFATVDEYRTWLQNVMEKANGLRTKRLAEELAVMRRLDVSRLAEFEEIRLRVTSGSTISVKRNIYSVPSRLRGEEVRVRVWEDRIEVYYRDKLQLHVERLRGEGRNRIDYRHIIWSLVKKPGAFRRYRYRDALFPTTAFGRAYDRLEHACSARKAEIEYLRILHLAASTMEADVEAAIELLREQDLTPYFDYVKALVVSDSPEIPDVCEPEVELEEYDDLLTQAAEVAR
jgi:hypothetical protein